MNNHEETAATQHLADSDKTSDVWQKLKKLFERAESLRGSDRDDFLKRECGNDERLRNEIDRLLASFDTSDSFLESPAAAEVASMIERSLGTDRESAIGNTFVAGTVLASRYRILGLLGRGGMGEVYKAEDIKLSQIVALKFLPERLQRDSAALARFHTEVRSARHVSHPNVCRVFDIGEIDGRHFLSMEYIEGDDLSSMLRRVGRLPSERGIEIARELCVGLSAIHKAGILHRDLKPANVIIDSKGHARITDFGIAGFEEDVSRDKIRAGTPAYMAPEQITGGDISQRSDIYSLGLVLYEIFTGKQAFSADSIPELIKKQQLETPTNPSDHVKGIDPLVESVIFQCLEKSPKDRPSTALHVAMALPGGNPMQIALDAGQTPSPEMIATTPRKGAIKLNVALACLATILLTLAAAIYLNSLVRTYGFVPLAKSPDVLAERAQTMIKSFGYTERPADIKYRFDFDSSFLEYAKANDSIGDVRPYLQAGQPAVILMTYRQSPAPMRPFASGRVFYNDPPQVVPGMVNTYVDTTGRLVEFSAVPPPVSTTRPVEPVNWSKFFSEAGLDIGKFETAESEWTPPFPFDERKAWKGSMADFPEIPLRIEAAGFQGRPTYFRVAAPWDTPRQAFSSEPSEVDWGYMVILVAFTGMVIGGILLVLHNVKSGRADLRGAYRLSVFIFLLAFAIGMVEYDHTFGSSTEFFILARLLGDAIFESVVTGMSYLALEPYVRRWWSDYLVSWSRLLVGDLRDPMVGRDILIGGVLGALTGLIPSIAGIVVDYTLGTSPEVASNFMADATNSLSRAIGVLMGSFLRAVVSGLGMFFMILIFFFLTRRKVVSIALFGVLLFIPIITSYKGQPLVLVGYALATSIFMVAIYRFGLLAMISFLFFSGVTQRQPLTLDPSSILFPQTLAALLMVTLLAGYAAWISIGGQRGLQSSTPA